MTFGIIFWSTLSKLLPGEVAKFGVAICFSFGGYSGIQSDGDCFAPTPPTRAAG